MTDHPENAVLVLGMGPGDPRWLPPAAADLALSLRTLFGDPRHLELLPPAPGQDRRPLPPRLADLPGLVEDAPGPVGVLVSGDPGFYSLARRLREAFGPRVRSLPGISCLQLLAARLGLPWERTATRSLHGRALPDPQDLRAAATAPGGAALLLGAAPEVPEQLAWLAEEAGLQGLPAALGWDLGTPREQVFRGTLGELRRNPFRGRLGLLWLAPPEPPRPEAGGAAPSGPLPGRTPCPRRGLLPDGDFLRHPGVPLTKAPLRGLVLALLAPLEGSRILEIGTGTGGVTAELARAGSRVVSLERNPEARDLAARHLERLGLGDQVRLVAGSAPEALVDLEEPPFQGAFVGGHGPDLEGVLDGTLARLAPKGRIVVASLGLATAPRTLEHLERRGLETGFWRIAAAEGRRLGPHWTPSALNPVDLIWGDLP